MSALQPEADIAKHSWDVRFARSGLMRRSKRLYYLITSWALASNEGPLPVIAIIGNAGT